MKKYNHKYGEYNNDIAKAIKSILKERGIHDWQEFLNPSESSLDDRILDNLDKASEMLLKHINNNSNILILVDSDVDGVTSASLCYDGIMDIAEHFEKTPSVKAINHKTKTHGIDKIMSRIRKNCSKIDLVIAPDSSSSDVMGMNELYKNGVDFLVLDHHPMVDVMEFEIPNNTVIVNNTVGNVSTGLSGVGVVYKLMKYIDDEHWIGFADDYLDVLAVGLIGDSMPCTDGEVNYFVRKGLKNIKNKLVVEMLANKLDGISPKKISFEVNPMMNVVFRQGLVEDKDLMFRAMSRADKGVRYHNNRAKSEDGTISTEHHFRLLAKRTKTRETKLVNEADFSLVKISDNGKLGMMDIATTDLGTGITGMLASKLSKTNNIPFLVYDSSNGFKGSCRSPLDAKNIFFWTEQFVYCEGHMRAFGIHLKKDFDINKIAKSVEDYESSLSADMLIDESDINSGVIDMVSLINKNIYSPSCPKITFKTTITLSEEDVFVNDKKTVMSIDKGGYVVVLFNPSDSVVGKIIADGKVEIIAEPGVNEYGSSVTYQLVICEII